MVWSKIEKSLTALTKKDLLILTLVFVIAIVIRFLYFPSDTYFGYDEARDAYVSQEIYTKGNLKILGPTTFFPGLNHGPLQWYLMGPMYLLSNGNPFVVSAIFRIINAFGVLLIFGVASLLFNRKVGYFAAIIYAFSFEETQYAMYMGNPALAIFSWMILFGGAGLVFRKKTVPGIIAMIIGVTTAVQFEFILLYTSFVALVLIFILKKRITIAKKHLVMFSLLFAAGIGNFILAEFKFEFTGTKTLISILTNRVSVTESGQSTFSLYSGYFLRLFHDNGIVVVPILLVCIIALVSLMLFRKTKNEKASQILLVWLFAGFILVPFGAYNSYYTFVGWGLGVIIAISYCLWLVSKKNKYLSWIILLLILIGNLSLIFANNKKSLIVDIKAQQEMLLSNEQKILDTMYQYANGRRFTVRVTSMPYKVQTVWAYLFTWYGQSKYGYLPLWETELVEGYPGSLPRPETGTTCMRFLIQEPVRGIPENLIIADKQEEDYFSSIVEEKSIGLFNLQKRLAKDANCH